MHPLTSYTHCPMCGTQYDEKKQKHPIHKKCFKCGYKFFENLRVAVAALIVNDGKLLLVKRAVKPRKGSWDVPGGFVDPDEHPERAILRELKEELGVNGTVEKLFGVFAVNHYEWQGKINYVCDLAYQITLESTELTPQDDVSEYQWFAFDELPSSDELAFKTTREMVSKLRSQKTPQ